MHANGRRRVRARIEGTVQGVGFRPYVFRLAAEHGLGGYVLNDTRGVLLEVEGRADAVAAFLARLPADAPPSAAVERVSEHDVPAVGERDFAIRASPGEGEPSAPVTPDGATCDDCLAELFDPADRRFRYPFVNCTNCGPRFTIVLGVPYDRPLTTMAGFTMCERCRAEYDDPLDRRFHAQPNACPACGPRVRLVGAAAEAAPRDPLRAKEGEPAPRDPARATDAEAAPSDALRAAAAALLGGAIVAVKGVGGYHLACRADDEAAVSALRARKHREDRPFALMTPDLAAARRLVELGAEEERLLVGRERPIVLAPWRAGAPVAEPVAPGARELGVMLPYSPLHHLLLADTGVPLVMTSGNVSDEPIAFRDEDALERLAGIADLFVVHDRPIHTRTDDSVVRAVALGGRRAPLMLRRSRGHVPAALRLPVDAPPLLACGAHLKNTFCLAKGRRAWVGHHIGDLGNEATLRSFTQGIAHFEALFAVAPEVVAHDLHPDYLSTRYALERPGVQTVGVQHHHAHLAACLAEHGESGPAVGAIFDGTGYGLDGAVWGGELLVGGMEGFERAGHLWPVRMPGGEQAIRQPWRMACAWLVAAHDGEPPLPPALAGTVEPERWSAVARLAASGFASPITTSMGRLFDAVAALCGLRATVTFEGQAAVDLEAACEPAERGAYGLDRAVVPLPPATAGPHVLDARATVLAIARDVADGVPVAVVAARFHETIARATRDACVDIARRRALQTVVLSGGVFQNRRLLERTADLVQGAGLRVLVPERLPPNDGGIAYGQVAVAAAGAAR